MDMAKAMPVPGTNQPPASIMEPIILMGIRRQAGPLPLLKISSYKETDGYNANTSFVYVVACIIPSSLWRIANAGALPSWRLGVWI